MNGIKIGDFAVSRAGHDFGKCYVIIKEDGEYVYLVDGKIRTLNTPKKKKVKHIKILEESQENITDKIHNHTIKNEEIKRAIKLLNKLSSEQGEEIS